MRTAGRGRIRLGTTWSPQWALFDWRRLATPRMFPRSDTAAAIASLEREFPEVATEEETMMALAKRALEREAEWHRQGLEEGLKQDEKRGIERGLAVERELLSRLAARKFGAAVGDALVRHLADISDPDRLAEIGERIIDCGTGAELIEWLGENRGALPTRIDRRTNSTELAISMTSRNSEDHAPGVRPILCNRRVVPCIPQLFNCVVGGRRTCIGLHPPVYAVPLPLRQTGTLAFVRFAK